MGAPTQNTYHVISFLTFSIAFPNFAVNVVGPRAQWMSINAIISRHHAPASSKMARAGHNLSSSACAVMSASLAGNNVAVGLVSVTSTESYTFRFRSDFRFDQ